MLMLLWLLLMFFFFVVILVFMYHLHRVHRGVRDREVFQDQEVPEEKMVILDQVEVRDIKDHWLVNLIKSVVA